MSKSLNILSRPKRAIHSRKLVVNEELAKLIGKDYNSESDEEFIPEKQVKTNKNLKNENNDNKNSDSDSDNNNNDDEVDDIDSNDENDEFKSDTDHSSSSTIVTNDVNHKDEENESDIADSERNKESVNESESNINDNSNKSKTENLNKNSDTKASTSINEKIKKSKNNNKKTTKKKQQNINTNDPKIKNQRKNKREYNKRKKLHQQKVDELKSENKKILEKLSSRLKPSTSYKSQNTTKSLTNNGPVVRLDKTTIDDITYPLYIISNNNFDIKNNLNSQNQNNKKTELNTFKIPKEKIPTVTDPKGEWLCKFCSHRPNYLSLGDLYGPYIIESSQDSDQEEDSDHNNKNNNHEANQVQVWFHEDCVAWTPNVYIKDNKLFGLSDAINSALNNDCNLCKKSGASLVCSKNLCQISYHYPCALNAKCKFDNENFTILCNKHS